VKHANDEDFEAEAGPIANPVDRFAHLPEPTRKFLEDLREDDIEEIKEAVRFMRSATTVGRFAKWSIISVVGFFIAASQFGEAIQKLWNWIGHGGRP
jgi:hypothetical protein